MTTILNKQVTRRTRPEICVRDRSKYRPIVITLHPSGFISLRLHKTRRVETIPIEAVYERAVMSRVARERMEKINARKNGKPYRVKRGKL